MAQRWFAALGLAMALTGITSGNKSPRGWRFVGGNWQLIDGQTFGVRFVGESGNGHGFAVALFSRYARTQTAEVTMTPLKRMGGGWSSGGLCVFQDGGNFWRLALVEAPDGQTRYAELVAMSNSIWQAQSEWRLKVVSEINPQFVWQWQKHYRLRIKLNPEQIVGEVFGVDGQLLWRRAFAFNNALIVKAGWLALNVQGMQAAFNDATQKTAESEAIAMRNVHQAVVVRDAAMGNAKLAGWLATELGKLGVQVDGATLGDLASPQWWQRMKAGIVVLPNGKRMPAAAKEPLTDFLRQGGKLVVFGAPLFSQPLFKVQRKWLSSAEMEATRKQTKPKRWLFERLDENELARWKHYASHPDVTDRLSLEPLPPQLRIPHRALRMDFTLKGWAIFSREFTESPFPKGHTLTCFWAKGGPQTKALMVEWREMDGTRWYAHLPLTTEWQLIVLSPRDFVFRGDSPTRGKRGFAGDRLNPQDARALVLGMEAPMPQGEHTIWVAGIGTAPDPFGDVATEFSPPTLEALSPAYKLYPLKWDTRQGARDKGNEAFNEPKITIREGEAHAEPKILAHQEIRPPDDTVAPVPRWRGVGFTNGERVGRWIPLLMAHDAKGNERGAIVWMMRHGTMPYPHASWLVFGCNDETFWTRYPQLLQTALQKAIAYWRNGVWILEAGTDRFTAHPGEQTTVGAVIVNDTDVLRSVTVQFTVACDERIVHEQQETMTVNALDVATVQRTLPALPSNDYKVTVYLLLEKQIDKVSHEFVVTERPRITDADKVTVSDGHFIFQGKRWFAFGVNFWPRFVAGQEQSDYWRHWLDPTNYDPDLVERDLLILREMGMNCVSVQYTNARQALSLRDFLRRCHEHGIKVNLFIAGAHPLQFQPELVRQLIEATDLANQPAIFAYDIAWEPRWGNYEQRRRHDAEWRAWLEEQYVRVENAERDWGFKLPRDEKGDVTVPKDEHLLNDGEWRIMAAAYRRFLDDFISRRYRQVCRFIRKLDPNHLIGARTGYGGGPFGAEGAFPFDHTAGAKHFDFISPEGWNLSWLGQVGEEQFARAAFITAYARWAGKGKPVFWAEFGLTLRHGAFSLDWYDDEERLQAQAKLYDAIYRLMQVSDADGAMGWWFPGGYRVDERSDFGIVNPDGTLRPAAEVAKRWGTILKNLPSEFVPHPASLVPLRIDRDENARGPMALWLKHGDEVARLVQEGKRFLLVTDGTGKTSDDLLDVAVGNTLWQPNKPPKFLNGEINAVWISLDGKEWREVRNGETVSIAPSSPRHPANRFHLRLELGNTGEVAWLPPNECQDRERGIVVQVQVDCSETMEVPIPHRVEPFGDVVVDKEFPLPKSDKPVTVTVRLHWRGSPFGERWRFTLQSPYVR